MPKRFLSVGLIAAKIAVTLLVLWLIARSVDVPAAARAMQRVPVSTLAMALALLGGQVLINGIRWSIIARDSGIKLGPVEAARLFWESLFFGQITPSGVGGDAWRVYSIARSGAAVANAMNSVVIDRLVGTAALLFMAFIGIGIEVATGQSVDGVELAVGLGLAGALVTGVLILLAIQKLPDRERSWDRFGLATACRRASMLLGEALNKPRLLGVTLAFSILGQILCSASVWVLAQAAGFPFEFASSLLLVPVALLISMVPITIAGWGLREGVLAAGFVRAGATLEVGAAVSVLFGLLLAAIGLIGGVSLWIGRRRIAPPAETAADAAAE